MPVEFFFPTPIYHTSIDNNIVHNEINYFMNSIKKSDINYTWDDNVLTTFTNYKNVLEHTPTLKKEINNECIKFLYELKINRGIKIIESWINVTKHLQFQNFHNHEEADISGVFYHKTSGDDGDIVFNHPSLVNRCNPLTKNVNSKVIHKPQKGKLILFPGFLEHAVRYNKTKNARISVAFNIKFCE